MIEKVPLRYWLYLVNAALVAYISSRIVRYLTAKHLPLIYRLFYQAAPMLDYGGYVMHTHMAVPPAVIAKPPAKKHKPSLHAALDSFYSDLATMEPVPAQPEPVPAQELAQEETKIPFKPMETDDLPTTTTTVEEPTAVTAKKKKTKKVSGLGLKKKGVSSLVAKWQQVQEEVRRDFDALDEDDA